MLYTGVSSNVHKSTMKAPVDKPRFTHLFEWLTFKKPVISSPGEDAELRPSYVTGGKAKWYSHCGKQLGGFL